MKALIDINFPISHIESWTTEIPYKPNIEVYPNSARICEVVENEFPVANPLFWVDCNNNITADDFYYDTAAKTINKIVNAPKPTDNGIEQV